MAAQSRVNSKQVRGTRTFRPLPRGSVTASAGWSTSRPATAPEGPGSTYVPFCAAMATSSARLWIARSRTSDRHVGHPEPGSVGLSGKTTCHRPSGGWPPGVSEQID